MSYHPDFEEFSEYIRNRTKRKAICTPFIRILVCMVGSWIHLAVEIREQGFKIGAKERATDLFCCPIDSWLLIFSKRTHLHRILPNFIHLYFECVLYTNC